MGASMSKWMGLSLVCLATACGESDGGVAVPVRAPTPDLATADDPFLPIPLEVEYDRDAAAIGESLYVDPILSGDGKVSCVDCHDLRQQGGTDGRPFSDLEWRDRGQVNATTVFNLIFNDKLGWIGKYDSMELHLDAPMMGDLVMDMESWDVIVDKLDADPDYRQRFERVFDDGITVHTVKESLVAYQRSLITPNAKFDRFLRGADHDGLSPDEAKGYRLFKELGCVSCHQGRNVGGNMLQKFGVMVDYPLDREPRPADYGRYNWTRQERDRFVFRVPSLRNVAVTAPYFHDGSAQTLEDAVRTMALHQLGVELDDERVRLIVAFLNTLTGEFEGKKLEQERK